MEVIMALSVNDIIPDIKFCFRVGDVRPASGTCPIGGKFIEKSTVDLFSNKKINEQSLLFEETEISFDDKNLFQQTSNKWNNLETLSNELEVIGFYFSDHPLNYFPEKFFEIENINSFNKIMINDK